MAPPVAEFSRVDVPVLYIAGTDDHAVGAFARGRTACYVGPGFRCVEVEGGTHYLSDTQPALVNRLLLKHIGASENAPGAASQSASTI